MSSDSYSQIKSIAGWILIIMTIYILYIMMNTYIFNENSKELFLLKSFDIPYIPKNVQLKDRDNKVSRHLKFRFVYTCPEAVFDIVRDSSENINKNYNNLKELFVYMKGGDRYKCFFVVNDDKVSIPKSVKNSIEMYPYKLYDTYVMGETRIFDDIGDILYCQGVDRDRYGEDCISTTYLNEICANKIEYIKYFMKHDLMLGTWIKPYYEKSEKNIYPGKYVKAPYSSRSACASFEKLGDGCFLDDGVIVQEKNEMLSKYEIKCYCLDGKVEMTIVRLEGRNYNMCIPDDYEGVSDDIKNVIESNKKEIYDLCKKTFYLTNALLNMRVAKLENDEKESQKILDELQNDRYNLSDQDRLTIRYTLTGLVNSEKIKIIDQINERYNKYYTPDKFTKKLIEYPDPVELKQKYKIYDRFMRVDMALPDNSKYDRFTVTEIEPFASGIYMYKTIGACMKNDEYNEFDNITKYNLYKIIKTIENSD